MGAGNQSVVEENLTGDETTDRPGSEMMLKSPWVVFGFGKGGGLLSINKIFSNGPEWLVGWRRCAEDRVVFSNSTDTELTSFQHGRNVMCIRILPPTNVTNAPEMIKSTEVLITERRMQTLFGKWVQRDPPKGHEILVASTNLSRCC